MIKTHSADPDVAHAAAQAQAIIAKALGDLLPAKEFDYGGHQLTIGEYDVCERCSVPIAEAQQANIMLLAEAAKTEDATIKEHLQLAADLFRIEAEAAIIRAEFHNGFGTEEILNNLLAYQYERHIGDDYQHSHHGGKS